MLIVASRSADSWGAAPLSRINEPAPIPATRRQTAETRTGLRVDAENSIISLWALIPKYYIPAGGRQGRQTRLPHPFTYRT